MQVCSSEDNNKDQYRPQFKLKHSIRTVLGKNSSHCKSPPQLRSALVCTYTHTCPRRTPLSAAATTTHRGAAKAPGTRDMEPQGPGTQLYPGASVTSTDSPRNDEYLRSITNSEHWCSKRCSQLCFLKDTEMLTRLSILQRC